MQLGAASILQPALGRVGGIFEAKKIAAMAETHYAQLAPHLYAGPIEGAANIQFAATLPNFLILESIQTWGGFHAEILKKPIQWQDGYVIVPDEPGLGVELNEEVALAHPYTGNALHLEVQTTPIDYSTANKFGGAPDHALRLHRPRPSRPAPRRQPDPRRLPSRRA